MSIIVRCACGRLLKARDSHAGKRAHCPTCAGVVKIPGQSPQQAKPSKPVQPARQPQPLDIVEFLDPPTAPAKKSKKDKPSVLRGMFEALLDPKSIQWMLMLGGSLLVLGIIVLLVNWLELKTPLVIATVMGAGTLALLGGGWFLSLKTSYKVAGRALAFLACVIAPLNLWYYHAQGLITLENHLWVGSVVCCLLYAATVRVLRDPLFMYAIEVGVTLTVLLFLPIVHLHIEATTLSIGLMVLALISIHVGRVFPREEGEFTRIRYGMPLFWCGQLQLGVSLLVLLGSQVLGWLNGPIVELFGTGFQGNLLTNDPLVAGGLWVAGTYAYLYSDFVVRRVGVYVYVAAFSLLMAIVTLIGWQFESIEAVIIVLAMVALAANLAQNQAAKTNEHLGRVAAPLGIILSGIPLLIGWVLHIRADSAFWGANVSIDWLYIPAMLSVAAGNRVSAHLASRKSIRQMAVYLFFSAAGLLMAAAGLLPLIGVQQWYQQAPLLMLIPIGYILASRYWRGNVLERPLGGIAHTATAVILFHTVVSSLHEIGAVVRPVQGEIQNVFLGLAFCEATVFYFLAGLFRKRSANAYFAAAAACGAMWQFLGYFDVAGQYHTILYAVLGVSALITARKLGLEEIVVYRDSSVKESAIRGRGLTAFQSGNAILSIALLSAFWQGIARLILGGSTWIENSALLITTVVGVSAVWIVPKSAWRRWYMAASIALAGLALLTISLEWLKVLSIGEKLELVCVVGGLILLTACYITRFRESGESSQELVGLGLFLGSALTALPLLIAVIYHRWWGDAVSVPDELGILAVTIVMLVTGVSWQTKAPVLVGGGCLTLYLLLLITELARRAEEMMGIAFFMAILGALVFGAGIALSVYRSKLLELPDRIANREGVFRIINWR